MSDYIGCAMRGLEAAIECDYPQDTIDHLVGVLADWLINPPTWSVQS